MNLIQALLFLVLLSSTALAYSVSPSSDVYCSNVLTSSSFSNLVSNDLFITNKGQITYFGYNYYDLKHVACESKYPPHDANLYAAISYKILSDQSSILNSGQCGRCIQLSSPKGSVVVTIVDVMMDDVSPYDVDLSYNAFTALSNTGGRDYNIKWDYVNCNGDSSASQTTTTTTVQEETTTTTTTVQEDTTTTTTIPAQQTTTTTTTEDAVPATNAESVQTTDNAPVPVPNALPTNNDQTITDASAISSTSAIATTSASVVAPIQKEKISTTSDASALIALGGVFVGLALL
ncbi:UNVERIFIED_CONTAM: hypothetical protein HDU68_008836 [Siphonaria sp. JEL0065]|nr:hypothetical protein HDU68_008836 [Siphonaria sp. JEL0065]